ncbi:MAG: aminotransferase class I/II-fold pyridoxal phosphate-dependent enzyme [Calditerrivibrio sp.]|uniref:aminotransferase class I/II-fold pyridoxal phosphate-dependent enzyme n=1 Tax=Calditerrivibrio sp. TaxID=2792612 RepID=UPI003D096D54
MVEKLIKKIDTVKARGNYRKLENYSGKDGKFINYDSKLYVNFSSNDYLGLSVDKEFLSDFYDNFKLDPNELGFSTASSRLLSGNNYIYGTLEKELSKFFEKDKTIVYNSGYHMNIGVLSALTDKKDLILSDKLNHASIVDGLRLSDAKHFRYKHLNYDELESYLNKFREQYENVFIVTESLFSMDGDVADIKKLVDIKKRYNCFLYVDEAHSVGVYGGGRGLSYEQGVLKDVDILAITFGKAFSSIGGAIITNEIFCELLTNFSRSLIFTTALPPVVLCWNFFVLKHMDKFQDRREKLFFISNYMRNCFLKNSFNTKGESYIIPYIVGNSEATVKISNFLKSNGFIAPAIRPPTVPDGSSRIRFSLNSLISPEDIDNLVELLKKEVSYENRKS